MKLPCRPAVLAAVPTALSLLGDETLHAVLPTYYEQLALKPFHVGVLLQDLVSRRRTARRPVCVPWPERPSGTGP